MATLRKRLSKRGVPAFQVGYYFQGKRRWISLDARYSERDAKEVALNVDRIVGAIATGGEVDKRTRAWLETIGDDLRERLASAGLVKIERVPTLGEIFEAYWDAEYFDLKPTTQSSKRQARRRFFEFVDPSTPFDKFTKREAAKFPAFLDAQVCEATKAGTIRDVRRVFNWALDEEIVDRNPFAGIRRGSFKNKTREYYVPMEDYRAMLDACPSKQWRVALALYRIGGLRFEEALRAQWNDVDFARGRLLVHSPKTERYKGRESRVIPLFPELRRELESLWDETPEGGSPYIIATNRSTIRKHFDRIIFLAGLNRWERIIQNLRSSRAIEIERDFGAIAEAEWIGHSPKTAREHYLHVLDEDFERAANPTDAGDCAKKSGQNSSQKRKVGSRDY